MQESLLHHIWKHHLFNHTDLTTSAGEKIEVINPGKHNTDSGPDFFDARIKIGDTLWAGNVEIHLQTSDWNKHNHQHDEMYSNIILHVVYENDLPLKGEKEGESENLILKGKISLLELQNYISDALLKHYDSLMLNQNKIPCAGSIEHVDSFTISNWLERMMIERLEEKTKTVEQQLSQNKNNWEETFYVMLARNFGFKINSLPFEMLARSLPLLQLAKHKANLFQIEALVFGQAGLLFASFKDDFPNELKQEYEYLQKKLSLQPIEPHLWKFMRLRPVNFPTIRLAQFAQLIYMSSHLFSKLIEIKNAKSAYDLFDVDVSEYWKSHFVFDKKTKPSEKQLGKNSIENILINTVVPLLFHYSKTHDDVKRQSRTLQILEQIPAETNHIISKWKAVKVKSDNAFTSQALIQLYNNYCSAKKCLICGIGNKILKTS